MATGRFIIFIGFIDALDRRSGGSRLRGGDHDDRPVARLSHDAAMRLIERSRASWRRSSRERYYPACFEPTRFVVSRHPAVMGIC